MVSKNEAAIETYSRYMRIFGGLRPSFLLIPPTYRKDPKRATDYWGVTGEFKMMFGQLYPEGIFNVWRPSDNTTISQDHHLVVIGCLTKCLLIRSLLASIPNRRFTFGRKKLLRDTVTDRLYELQEKLDYGVALSTTTPWGKRLICCFGITAVGCYGAARILLSQRIVEQLALNCGKEFEFLVEVPGDETVVKSTKVIAGNLKGQEFDTDIQSLNLEVKSPYDINQIVTLPTLTRILQTEPTFLLVPGKGYTAFAGTEL